MAVKKQSGRSATIKDVAARAGVSRTAVSYVLNDQGQRNKHVSDETRAKVLQAVEELNFRPDAIARTLSRGHSEEIVLTIGSGLSPFLTEVINSLQAQASSYGYTYVMYLSQGLSGEKKKALYEMILARRPLAIITTSFDFSAEDVGMARKMGVKYIVFLAFHPVPIEGTYSIVFPSEKLGYLAARYLIERGHHRLALVKPADPIQEEAFEQRLKGMQAAVAEKEGVNLGILPLELASASAHSLVESSLLDPDHPTGIYGFSDEYALVLLGALMRHKVEVPQEVALVGTDNLPLCDYVWPALTSICFDAIDIGKRAAELIYALHKGQPLKEELTQPLAPQLIERAST